MPEPIRTRSYNILAESVSDVVGKRNVAYSAIREAAEVEDRSKENWASTVFNQISAINRRRIRMTAIDKAEDERARSRRLRAGKSAALADLSKLFGNNRAAV
ncbi:MAG: hypothetical protein HQ481_02210 [Alphaproteobacteria bacterium]|nr:hypothetical protein [Alphaproteobacteria bacterium]